MTRSIFRFLADQMKPSNVPAALTLAVMLAIACFAGWQSQVVSEQENRGDVLKEVGLIRAKLEGNLNANIQLVRGLIAVIATEPEIDQQRFTDLAANLVGPDNQLRSIAGAPNFVINLVYPYEGNEAVMGLDLATHPVQSAAALKARDTGRLVLTGPVELVQGGRAFIARFPVYLSPSSDRPGEFWGVLSAVIDIDKLWRVSGLDASHHLDISIAARDDRGRLLTPLFGDMEPRRHDPVLSEVALPSGSWQIAAIPAGGWHQNSARALGVFAGFVALALLVTVPVYLNGRLMEERQRNMGELGRRESELRRLSRRLGLALETSQVGVWEYDLQTGELLWDARVRAIFGKAPGEEKLGYRDWRDVLHPDDLARAEREFSAAQISGHYESVYRIITRSGAIKHVKALAAVYTADEGGPKIIGVNWDVSTDVELNESLMAAKRLTEARNAELEAAKASIEFNALHDSLTGLPNRRYLDEVLGNSQRQGRSEPLALLHLDLDRFKQINDRLGHAAGDVMLRHAAKVLRANIRGEDFVARVGGDEFVVISRNGASEEDLAHLAERIIARMAEPVSYEGHECRSGVSVGIARCGDGEADIGQLLINADIALYRAKSAGRNRYEFFTRALQAEVVRSKQVADELVEGLQRGEIVTFFQPQFDARTLEIVGVEALARWRHPERGLLAPSEFLDVAEDLHLVATIDGIVLEQALAALDSWRMQQLGIPKVSVNVSARRLRDDKLIASLEALNIEPGTLSFELLESIFLDETDDVSKSHIAAIRDLGIDIEIDDFGTGYTSILSLMQIRPRRLKIDRQLVMPVVSSASQRRLVESIVEIGRSLDIEVLGEGVESMAHARLLRDLGCVALQGYALAPPMEAEAMAAFVRERRWARDAKAAQPA